MDVLRAAAERDGFFSRTDAIDAGVDDESIRRAIRAGGWVRVRRGAYTFPDLWPDDPVERHRAIARAAAARIGRSVALSHVSAAAEHGLLLWNVDLANVHVTRLDGGSGRTEAGVVHHEGFTLPTDLLERDGHLLITPARAALETASLCDTESALVVLDSVLHRELTTPEELTATYALMRSWPGMLGNQVAVRLADGRAESVGESRTRYLCYAQHVPAPEPQFEVRDASGRLVGTTDFAWPGLLGEFDGKVKYGRYLREGETPGDAVFREKRREDLLCELTGWRMIRFTWADLYDAAGTAARIRRMLRRVA